MKHRDSLDCILEKKAKTHNSRRAAHHHQDRYGTRTGLAALPVEVLRLVCRFLCLCSYCDPDPDPFHESALSRVQFRDDLDSLSRTCKLIRDVAQPYIFHILGFYDSQSTLRLALKLSCQVPHIANQVRRITLTSIWGELFLLGRLTGLHTLRVIASKAGITGPGSQLSFPALQEFCYGPCLDTESLVHIEDARKDLRAILTAAERLSHLRCHRLTHILHSSPNILLRLPACNITTLELHQCWLPGPTFRRFMANFPCLQNFRLKWSLRLSSESGQHQAYPEDGPARLTDATDVVEALNPNKEILRRLVLDFGRKHEFEKSFRSLPPMKNFTALRTMHLSQGVAGYTWSWNENLTGRDSLAGLLPASIEVLCISQFDEHPREAVLDLAKQASSG